MQTSTGSARTGRRLLRGLLASLVALAFGSGAAIALPTAANAAELDAITSVTITDPPPYQLWQTFRVDATWAVPDSAVANDTFTLNFPDAMVAYNSTFDLIDTNDGVSVVGTCVVTSSQMVCTLSSFVDTHTNVRGTLYFQAEFVESNSEETIVFTTGNSVTFTVPTPGGIDPGESEAPDEPVKWGWVETDGESIGWQIVVPAEYLTGDPVVITDTYDPALTLDPQNISVVWVDDANWGDSSAYNYVPEGTAAGTYTLVNRPGDHAFDVILNDPVTTPDRVYMVYLWMAVPDGAKAGDTFGNTAQIANTTVVAEATLTVDSGGTGTGDNLGDFAVTKAVTGTGAAVVAGATYTVDYAYSADGQPVTGSLTLTDGATDGVTRLPEGTVVTLSEVAATAAGVTFGTPVFTGVGVTDNGDGTATFTITDGTINVGLENPVTRIVGGFALTKWVTGSGATQVADADYTVTYAYTVDGQPVTGEVLTVANGQTVGVDEVPEGTIVTLSEVVPARAGVMYGTPVFAGQGVTDNQDGTATLTITDGTVQIGLTNPVTSLGGFAVTKRVTGTGAQKVAGTAYTVAYEYAVDGVPVTGRFAVAHGETVGIGDIPAGTVVKLSEVLPVRGGVNYANPVFTGVGVTDNHDGTATLIVTDGTVQIGLENPVSEVPPPSSRTRVVGGPLAHTGFDATPWAVAAGIMIAAAGVALVAGRRREQA